MSFQSVHSQRTILWSIKKENSPKTSYVLGTFHQMGNSFVDDRPIIKQKLLQANLAVFESVDDAQTTVADLLLSRPEDFSYQKFLSKKDVAFLDDFSSKWQIPVSKLRPNELIFKLQQQIAIIKCGTVKASDTLQHFDNYLMSIARKNHITMMGLETFSDQIDAIDGNMSGSRDWTNYKKVVHQYVKIFNRKVGHECDFAQNYINMNFDYQFDVKCAENDPILINRNQKWMPQIISQINSNQSVFIATGLLHLFGECGIISQLRDQGFIVNPIEVLKN